MANQYEESYLTHRNFRTNRLFPEVRECMNDILDDIVKRSCYQTALNADSIVNKMYNNGMLIAIDNQTENEKIKKKPREKKTVKKKVTKKKTQTILSQQKQIGKQERICKRKQQELDKANVAVNEAKKMLDNVNERIKTMEIELNDVQKQIEMNENILSRIPEDIQIESLTSSTTSATMLVAPSEPNPAPIVSLKDLKGPEHLIASKLPPNFPPDLAFRALSTYALVRSVSLPLRLSPFNPTSFLRALALPIRTRLLGEVHLSLLGYLFSSIKTGVYESRGSFHRDSGTKAARGGLNLNYMDSNTWTLFFEDYVEFTIEKFIADDDVMTNTHKLTGESKDDKNELVHEKISTGKDLSFIDQNLEESAKEVEQVFQGESDDSDVNDDSDSDGDVEEYIDSSKQLSSRKSVMKGRKDKETTLLNGRPSRGAKIEAAKRIKETNSDDDSTSESNDETSLQDPPSNKSVTSVQPLNHDSALNPQSSLTESVTQSLREKEIDLPSPITAPIKRKRGRPRKIPNPKKAAKENLREKRKRGRPAKKKKKIDEKPIAIDRRSKADRQSINAIKLEENRSAGRPFSIITPPEPVSSHISTALTYYLSTAPDKPMKPHASPIVQAKISLLKNLPHINAARKLRHGQSYHDLPILTKLELLEFLIDDFLQTYPISCELLHRHRITSYYQGKYGLLPSKTELGKLTNVDECVVCGLEGDLICCDGCIASYHCKCTGLASEGSLPEGIWLCPECRIPNPSKFGPLYGGSKAELDWFSMKDFIPVVQSEQLTTSLQNLRSEKPTIGLPQSSITIVPKADSDNISSEVPGSNHQNELNKPITEGHAKNQNETINNTWNNTAFLPTPKLNANMLKLSQINLRPSISFSDDRDFMIIHGFIFIRRKEIPFSNKPQSPPIALSQTELFDFLRLLGPNYSLKWPWCQIPFNPFDIWEDVIDSLDTNTMSLFEEKRKSYSQYFLSEESHNPTLYENEYGKAELPPYLSIMTKSSGPNFRRDEVLRFQVLNGLSRDLEQDPSYLEKLFSHELYYDVLYSCKEYIIKLEKTLLKSCFLCELWGMNKHVIPNLWMKKVLKCKSVNKLAKLCIELVDSTHARAFYDDWNRPIAQTKSRYASELKERTQIILTDDWTAEKECVRRDWERSNTRDSLTLLMKEGNRLGGWARGRKKRNTKRLDLFDPSLPTLTTTKKFQGMSLNKKKGFYKDAYFASIEKEMIKKAEIENRLALEESIFQEKKHEAKMQNELIALAQKEGEGKGNLAMTPGAIRARERRRREKEEREKLKRETLRRVMIQAEYTKQKILEESKIRDAKTETLDQSEGAVTGHAQEGNEKKKKKKKKVPLSSRRRSGRHISRPLTVEEAIDSLAKESSTKTLDLALALEINPSIDLEIKKARREKIGVLEKILEKNADREPHWPICGGFFFPPAGNLPLPILKRLARNAGMKLAPFMTYSNKFEVAQPSQSHCWRKKTIECDTIEELCLQLTILDSFLNRPTIHSCDVLSRRSENVKASVTKVIQCTHYDSLTGLMEHFVLNKKKRKGTWLSEIAVDQSALILERSNRIAERQQKFDMKLFEKRRKERAVREEKDREINMKKNAQLTLKNAHSRASMIHNAIFYAKNDVLLKLEGVKQTEDTRSNLETELNEEKELLQKQKANLFHEMERKKKEEEEKQQQSMNNKFKNDASEAQLERAFLEYIDHDIQNLNAQEDSATNFLSDELKYENAFQNAVNSHKQATKRLLKESADLGLSTVPVEKMNEERIIHMARMKDSNRKLLQMKSSKYIDDDGLTKALAEAEDAGLRLYVKQAKDEKQFSKSSSEYNESDKSLFNDNDDSTSYEGFSSRGLENHSTDESIYVGHQPVFDQNSLGNIGQQIDSNRFTKQQQVQQMTEQNLVAGAQQLSQANRGDYSGMSKAMTQSEFLLMQPRRSSVNQLELCSNIGQRMSTELNNQYLLELERQPQVYQRDGSRAILDDSNSMSKSDIFSAQLNNQMLMRPNLYGDSISQFSTANSNFSTLPSNFQGGNNYPSLRNQQFSGQYSDRYTNSNILDYDNVNNAALRPMDNSFTQQVQQQRNQQSYMHGASQQRTQMSLGLSQIDQHGRLIPSNRPSLQGNNNHNSSNFNLW